MKFENSFLSREHRYWLGIETESGEHFAAIPVSNQIRKDSYAAATVP